MACRNYDLRDAALPILPSGLVALEIWTGHTPSVLAFDAAVWHLDESENPIVLRHTEFGFYVLLSELYTLEQVQYYLDVARNMADEIAFQNSIAL